MSWYAQENFHLTGGRCEARSRGLGRACGLQAWTVIGVSNMEAPQLEASPKEKFDTLFGLLKDNYAGLFDFEFKNVTVLTLLLGWSLASNDARSFLHTHRGIASCACVAVLLYGALLSISVWKFYRRSLLAYTQLSELGYMPTEYFRMRQIQPFTVVSFTALNLAVAFLIIAVILFT